MREARAAQFSQQNLITPVWFYNEQPSNVEYFGKYLTYKPQEKVAELPKKPKKTEKLLKNQDMDIKFIQAVQQPDRKFKVEEYFYVPRISSDYSAVPSMPVEKIVRPLTSKVKNSIKSQKLELQEKSTTSNSLEDEEETATVKVESIGMSAADQPFPDFSPYFPRMTLTQDTNGEESTLILEPHSKAVSGNDGISISTPLSRALLRRGTAVKLLFRPESVAISGAGGTSHAQADLILDFIDE